MVEKLVDLFVIPGLKIKAIIGIILVVLFIAAHLHYPTDVALIEMSFLLKALMSVIGTYFVSCTMYYCATYGDKKS